MFQSLSPTLLVIAGASLVLSACAPTHIAAFSPRSRGYDLGEYAQTQEQARPSSGSIYSEAIAGYLEDTRAVRIGDIVHVTIDEHADAKGGASTALSHESTHEDSLKGMLGLLPALQKAAPELDPSQLISFISKSTFNGDGQTSRAGELKGSIAVRVKKEMPNGDLYIEGTKVVMINNEEYHLYISGVIRPSDIEMDNSVQSTRLADAEVEFTGRGDVASTVKRGWFTTFLDWINPF